MKIEWRRALGAGLLCATPALQATAADRFQIAAEGGYLALAAKDSAKAVFDGKSGGPTFGGSARFYIIPRVFVGVAYNSFSKSGERVFVANAGGKVFPLGHPLDIELATVQGVAGFRPWPEAMIAPYVSLGVGQTSYEEESTIGGQLDSGEASKVSWSGALGADYKLPRLGGVGIGVELRYTSAKDIVGKNITCTSA